MRVKFWQKSIIIFRILVLSFKHSVLVLLTAGYVFSISRLKKFLLNSGAKSSCERPEFTKVNEGREQSRRQSINLFYEEYKRRRTDKIIHTWAHKILKILRVRHKIFTHYPLEFKEGRPYIIMSNHASHFDIPLIYETFPQESVGMLSKKELFYIPFFGWGMKHCGSVVAINRKRGRQALRDLAEAKKVMLSGVRIYIAPEGTRSRTGNLGPFKRGGFKLASEAGAIIIPVAIIGSNKILPAGTLDFSMGEKVTIHVGKPIDVTTCKEQDSRKLMQDVASSIQNLNTSATNSKPQSAQNKQKC